METDDIGILLDMAHAEGWSSDVFEFELFHKLNPGGCFSAIADNSAKRAKVHSRFNMTTNAATPTLRPDSGQARQTPPRPGHRIRTVGVPES